MENVMLTEAIEGFPWDSEVQKEGFLNLVQYWRKFGRDVPLPIQNIDTLTALFFIQKDHEANEYWSDLLDTQLIQLQDQVKLQQDEIRELRILVDGFQTALKAQNLVLENITTMLKK
jgi:hypothetical protein